MKLQSMLCQDQLQKIGPPSPGFKFPCLLTNHKHEVSTCAEFFNLSPKDRWKNIEKDDRMCFSCLKPRSICKSRRCNNVAIVPDILKCAVCASWAVSKGLAPFSIFVCKQKQHRDSRSPLAELKKELEKYIGKLGTTIVDSKIQVAVNFMFQNVIKEGSVTFRESSHGARILPPAPTFDSKTGIQVLCQEENVCFEISESSIYLMQNLRIGDNHCLTFFDSGANAHLIDKQLARVKTLLGPANIIFEPHTSLKGLKYTPTPEGRTLIRTGWI